MPGTARAPKRRSRAAKAAAPADPVSDIAIRMHQPMEEAIALLRALVLVGHGMNELGNDDALAVLTLARAASERLAEIDDSCIDLIQAARA